MKNLFIFTMLSLISLSVKNYSQDVNIKNNEKAGIDSVAVLFLTDVSDNSPIQSGLIYPESLEKFKEHMISISLEYDSSGHTNAMMLLPADSLRSMTPAQVWDNMNRMKHYLNVQKLNTTWHIVKTEIENNIAFVTYDIKDGEQKVMKLKKDENKWKVILSGKSIF